MLEARAARVLGMRYTQLGYRVILWRAGRLSGATGTRRNDKGVEDETKALALLAAGVMLLCGMPAAGAEASAPLTEGAAPSAGPIAGPAAVVPAGRDAPAPDLSRDALRKAWGWKWTGRRWQLMKAVPAAGPSRRGIWLRRKRRKAKQGGHAGRSFPSRLPCRRTGMPSPGTRRRTHPVWKAMEPYGWGIWCDEGFHAAKRTTAICMRSIRAGRMRLWSLSGTGRPMRMRHLEQYDLAQAEEDVDRLFPTNGYLHGAPYFYRQKSGGARFLCLGWMLGFPLYTNAQQDTLLYTTVYHRRELDVALFPLDGSHFRRG